MNGMKFDGDKLRFDLLPPDVLTEVTKVLTAGAKKYADNNWQILSEGDRRYYAAALRHIFARQMGEEIDSETGVNHYAHAICCLIFLLWYDLHSKKDDMSL